ncbi:Meckel syndrome type 1 protein-like isoform X2 [Venturia canescens]|uniref:Meckel syndrome type 1 protein-like isoform X2 n=1 Tax=Venturia canescens TaxID=32260 RepID=UPI001C9D05FF|nr:Meckel syndrome type 1 protein-like isoform X2 [Venturia canescens]
MLVHPTGRLKIAATYRVNQPIENFVLRIKIVEQKSLLAELFEENEREERQDSNYLVIEERDLAWQEKIFSPNETKLYADEKNCVSDLHKEYNRKILLAGDEEQSTGVMQKVSRVYSYTHRDSYYPDKLILTNNYVSELSKRNERALPIVKNQKPFSERYNKKVVEADAPNENHYLYKDRTRMYILADLSSKDELITLSNSDTSSLDSSEILLCTLTYDRAAKTLTIDPDLTSQIDSYTIRTNDLYYDYWIEDVSNRTAPEPLDDDTRKSHSLIERENAEMYREMMMPPGCNVLRLFVNLEIASAENFFYEPLFVNYKVDLPRDWTIIGNDADDAGERLTGTSQRCHPINGKAHFGYLTEISLDFDLNRLNASENVQPAWPYLIFTVGSIDQWTRYRNEGYACIPLPASPGTHSFVLPTWRPIGRLVNVLRRFFTGGTVQLEDITYCGIPEPRQSTRHLEKTPLKVISGGSITINLNIAHQSKIFTKIRDERDEGRNSTSLINSLDSVLVQFKAARDRMIRARCESIDYTPVYQ